MLTLSCRPSSKASSVTATPETAFAPSPTATELPPPPTSTSTLTPAPSPTSPAARSVGPFHQITTPLPALSGDTVGLRVASDGSLWVATMYGFARWQDDQWQTYPPADFRIRDMLLTPDGTLWLAHDRGVFQFYKGHWRSLSLADMELRPPLNPDNFTPYTLEWAGDWIWVGRCEWGSAAPLTGDLRWFDGTDWRGEGSPVAANCITAVREDSRGHVWVAADADLWRYDPVVGDWAQFAPPEPPAGDRFGFIADLALDPTGQPWPLYAICDGANCGQLPTARYRLENGTWTLVREQPGFSQRLIFDDAGVPWLFALPGAVYRFRGEPQADTRVDGFIAEAVTTDTTGRIWVLGRHGEEETSIWMLESEAEH